MINHQTHPLTRLTCNTSIPLLLSNYMNTIMFQFKSAKRKKKQEKREYRELNRYIDETVVENAT